MKKFVSFFMAICMLISFPLVGEAKEKPTTWQKAYKEFVEDQGNYMDAYYIKVGAEPTIALFDMDKIGTPELFIQYGDGLRYKIYSFINKEVKMIGEVERELEKSKFIIPALDNGLYHVSSSKSEAVNTHYTIKDNRIRKEDISRRDSNEYDKEEEILIDTFYSIEKEGNKVKEKKINESAYNKSTEGKNLLFHDPATYDQILISYADDLKYKSSGINVTLNGRRLSFNLPVENKGGTTFYPFRELLEAAGATVSWNQETNTAIGKKDKREVRFTINSSYYTVKDGIETTKTLPNAARPYISNGRTYIPIRYAMEGLGYTVKWDTNTDTVVITK